MRSYAGPESIRSAADDNFVWFITEENIDYVYIDSMDDFGDEVYLEPDGERSFLGPVAVLTSGSTGSAAEVFVMAMRTLPNVALIGEPTLGTLSDILDSRVTSDIAFGFSNEYYISTDGD